MTVEQPELKNPPRLEGSPDRKFSLLSDWGFHLIRQLAGFTSAVVERVDPLTTNVAAIAAVDPIADPSTASAEDVAEKLNEIIAAARSDSLPEE